ncbi:MAG: hypothetical protein PUD93_04355 [Lachnospiraceae bacterium]|nr:hypothetical protein [Lachnospiraceae bacterium]
MENLKEISIKEIENIKIGNAENKEAGTGCTVIICEKGAPTGLDVRGGGPASRESELLKPVVAAQDMVGTLAAQVMSEAILRAVMSADSAYGFIAAKDL